MWHKKRNLSFLILVGPALVFIVVFFFIPILYALNVSFYTFNTRVFFLPIYTFENYLKFFSDPFYLSILIFTLELSATVTILALLVGYPIAYKLAKIRSNQVRIAMMVLLISPMLISSVVQIYGWIVILSNNGIINSILGLFGIGPLPLLWNANAVVIGLLQSSLPIMVLSIYGVIGNIDSSLVEAARGLGADRVSAFLRITLPLSYPGIIAGGVLVFASVIPSFVYAELLGGGRVQTVGTLVVSQFVGGENWPFGTAMGFVLLLIALTVLVLSLRVSRTKVGATSY